MLTIERIEDVDRFATMAEEWNALLADSGADCFFLTWEWLYTWWQHLADRRRLFLLVVRNGEELVGIAPLAIAPRELGRLLPFRSLQLLGTGTVGSDYLDVIIRRGWEDEAVGSLAEHLQSERAMLELRQLRPEALAWRLAERLEGKGWSSRQARTEVCPFISLTGHTWDSYLGTLGSAHRYNVQRRLRNLRRDFAVRFEHVQAEEDRAAALERLIRLHQARWHARGESEAFVSPALVSFHQALSQRALGRGWLRLRELWLDGRSVAGLYGFRYGNSFLFYQSGLDPAFAKQSVGLVTMALAIKGAIEEGATEYDLLHGAEPYKFLWARDARELRRLEVYPPLWRGFLCQRTLALGRAARRTARRVLPRSWADRMAGARPFGLGRA
jgi:CelD/BcsL family acetyltransferase involved in cellulose biosynthesis